MAPPREAQPIQLRRLLTEAAAASCRFPTCAYLCHRINPEAVWLRLNGVEHEASMKPIRIRRLERSDSFEERGIRLSGGLHLDGHESAGCALLQYEVDFVPGLVTPVEQIDRGRCPPGEAAALVLHERLECRAVFRTHRQPELRESERARGEGGVAHEQAPPARRSLVSSRMPCRHPVDEEHGFELGEVPSRSLRQVRSPVRTLRCSACSRSRQPTT